LRLLRKSRLNLVGGAMADKSWRKIHLGEVLEQVWRATPVDSAIEYPLLGAHWYAKGLYVKEVKPGTNIKASKLYRVECGDFVYNRLFAWKGSFAVATDNNDGCYVSNEFPCFKVNSDRIDAQYLWHYFSRQASWNEALGLSYGATPTSRNRLKEKNFLSLEIPLPPVSDQRRIVAKIERLAGKIEGATRLRQRAVSTVEAFRQQVLFETFEKLKRNNKTKRFSDVCSVVRGGSPRPAGSAIFYNGQIPFLKVADLTKDMTKYVNNAAASIKEAGLSKTRLVPPGTLLLTNSGATLGVPKICTISTTMNDGIQAFLDLDVTIYVEYLYYFLLSRTLWFRQIEARGQGQPNLNTTMIKNLEFPFPTKSEQIQVVEYLDKHQAKLNRLKALQAETATELGAMLPSILDRAFKGEL